MRQRSEGHSVPAEARIGNHDALLGPTSITPARAGRVAPGGNFAAFARSVSLTCVPFGEKLGAGLPSLPSPGAWYVSVARTEVDCANVVSEPAAKTRATTGRVMFRTSST